MLYFIIEVDPGKVSPYDLMYDQRIKDRLSELGAEYPIKIMRIEPTEAVKRTFATS